MVESCVNYVGVDLNTASKELLAFVSITPTVAKNIIIYRNEHGAFEIAALKVPKVQRHSSNQLDSAHSRW